MRVPTRKSELLAQTKKTQDRYLTEAAISRMRAELERLEKQDRPEAAEEVRRTGAMGDLSENAAYQVAKASLRRINGRILSLQEKIKYAIPIPELSSGDGRVRIGSTVTIATGGREQTFLILGSQETNPLRGRISYLSPIGSALMGHAAGETVVVALNGKETAYQILTVR